MLLPPGSPGAIADPMPRRHFPFWTALVTHSQQRRLSDLLRRQLAKDLQLPLREIPGENLIRYLRDQVAELMRHPENLAALCYRIDIHEEAMAPTADAEALAMLILEREASKIIFREQYAGRLP